jgi:hypothetical protein
MLGKLQFPWRWQAIAGAGLALLVAVGWQAVGRRRQVGPVGQGEKRQFGDMTYLAVALAMAYGPAEGLALVDQLTAEPSLKAFSADRRAILFYI